LPESVLPARSITFDNFAPHPFANASALHHISPPPLFTTFIFHKFASSHFEAHSYSRCTWCDQRFILLTPKTLISFHIQLHNATTVVNMTGFSWILAKQVLTEADKNRIVCFFLANVDNISVKYPTAYLTQITIIDF
jgi:hypothetical protein